MDIQDDIKPEDPGEKSTDEVQLKGLVWIKLGARLVVGAGVSHIIYSAVESNVTDDNFVQKVATFAGKIAINMVVSEIVKSRIDEKIDKAAYWYVKNVKEPLA